MYKEYDMDMALTEYMDKIQLDYDKFNSNFDQTVYKNKMPRLNVTINTGSKFYKVVVNKSVHSFVCKKAHDKWQVGDILKAASWKAPAKNFVRGNVLTQEYTSLRWSGV
jgi:hypothetical protein